MEVAEFEEFFLNMRPRLHAYARRWTDPDSANELAIHALSTIWDKGVDAPTDAQSRARLESLTYRVCDGLIKNHLRSVGRHRRLVLAAQQDLATKTDSVPDAEAALEMFERLNDLLGKLSPTEREVIDMTIQGYKVGEIAKVLETKPGTISMRLKRARETMQAQLEVRAHE